MHARTDRSLRIWQSLGALLLLAMGGIHLYLVVFSGFDGLIGTLFILNAIGGLVLAVAILASPRRFLFLVSLLSLLFMAGTLAALLISLTPAGFLGVREQMSAQLVTETIVVEAVGTLVLLVTTLRARRI
jgi:hypothetical protein